MQKKWCWLIILGLFCSYQTVCWGQGWQLWKTLAKVQFQTIKQQGKNIDKPIFSTEIQALAGREVEVKGYLIPLEEFNKPQYFILSAYPYSECYFCGGAGIETVMEVYTQKPIAYTPKPITLKGRLKLNPHNPDNLLYILENALRID